MYLTDSLSICILNLYLNLNIFFNSRNHHHSLSEEHTLELSKYMDMKDHNVLHRPIKVYLISL